MNRLNSIVRFTSGAALVTALAGCSWLNWFSSTPQEDAITIVKRMQESAESDPAVAAAMKEVPVHINYAIKSKPMPDEDLHVEIDYLPQKDLKSLKVGYGVSDGLELITRSNKRFYQDLKKNDTITQNVTVVPAEEGHYFLRIYLVSDAGEEQRGKMISVPIGLGKFSLEAPTSSKEVP